MKRHHKITLASLGVALGILSGTLTIIEKSINIVNNLKAEPSDMPENTIVEKGVAVGIDKDETKMVAQMGNNIK